MLQSTRKECASKLSNTLLLSKMKFSVSDYCWLLVAVGCLVLRLQEYQMSRLF
ncbi:hypothetical protein OIU76_002154 [Salix suchowensis]|nr:hypothetical protein OIU76_002154 [Salix suchowensis]